MKTGRWTRREISLAAAVAMIAAGCGLVALCMGLQSSNDLTTAAFMGTFFGHASLAGGWTALGPFRMVYRLPLSATWLAGLILGVALGAAMSHMAPIDLLWFSGSVVTQWILVQIPLWVLLRFRALRIGHADDSSGRAGHQQFGIREVMILTMIAAAVLGIGRWLLAGVQVEESDPKWLNKLLILSLLVGASSLATLPMLAAALLPQWTKFAICVAFLFALFITGIEVSLFARLPGFGGPPLSEVIAMFASLNLVQCAWVLAFVLTLRAGGFRLISGSGNKA